SVRSSCSERARVAPSGRPLEQGDGAAEQNEARKRNDFNDAVNLAPLAAARSSSGGQRNGFVSPNYANGRARFRCAREGARAGGPARRSPQGEGGCTNGKSEKADSL